MATKSVAFPPALDAMLRRRAESNHRSFSGEVVSIVEDYLTRQADVERRITEIENAILRLADQLG